MVRFNFLLGLAAGDTIKAKDVLNPIRSRLGGYIDWTEEETRPDFYPPWMPWRRVDLKTRPKDKTIEEWGALLKKSFAYMHNNEVEAIKSGSKPDTILKVSRKNPDGSLTIIPFTGPIKRTLSANETYINPDLNVKS